MKKQDAFLFNECFVLLGFILCLRGYDLTGTICGIIAILSAFHALNVSVLKNEWFRIFLISFLQLILLEITHLNAEFPSIYFLSLTSLIVSFTWSHAGFKALHYGMKWMNGAGIFFLIADIVIPWRTYTFLQTMLIILFIFFPSDILYLKRQFRHYIKQMHRQKKIAVVQ